MQIDYFVKNKSRLQNALFEALLNLLR
jgi:hypothetical protein